MRPLIAALLLSACAAARPCVDEHTGRPVRDCSFEEMISSPEWRISVAAMSARLEGIDLGLSECRRPGPDLNALRDMLNDEIDSFPRHARSLDDLRALDALFRARDAVNAEINATTAQGAP